MNDILFVIISILAAGVFMGLEGGAVTCAQAIVFLVPAAALALASFSRSSMYEPVEKRKKVEKS